MYSLNPKKKTLILENFYKIRYCFPILRPQILNIEKLYQHSKRVEISTIVTICMRGNYSSIAFRQYNLIIEAGRIIN